MNREQFDELYAHFVGVEGGLLDRKRGEYTDGDDVLANFKATAEALGLSSEDVCAVLLLKHVQAIVIAARDKSTRLGFGDASREGFSQRIADARNYLVLLAALVGERPAASISGVPYPGGSTTATYTPPPPPPRAPCVHPAASFVMTAAGQRDGKIIAHGTCGICGEDVVMRAE